MTTSTSTLDHYTPDDASYKAWAKGISDGLQAVGLVKTADTGQIDFTQPVTRPGSGSDAGYEIYSMGAGATKVALKVRYSLGSAGGNASPAKLHVAVATGSDGAGNLTGPASSDFKGADGSAPQSSTPISAWFASDGATYLTLVLGANLNGSNYQYPFALVMGRTVAADGTPTGDGWTCHWTGRTRADGYEGQESESQGVAGVSDQYWVTSILRYHPATQWGDYLGMPVGWPVDVFDSASSGDDLYFFPAPPVCLPSPTGGQPMEYLGVYANDIVIGSEVTLQVNGAPHHYKALGRAFDGADLPSSYYNGYPYVAPETWSGSHCAVARFE